MYMKDMPCRQEKNLARCYIDPDALLSSCPRVQHLICIERP